MTPREVEAMDPDEYTAFLRFMEREAREIQKKASKRGR